MILTKRRLIVFSVALGVLLLLIKVTANFFDDSPTGSSREFEQAVDELPVQADRGSAQANYRLGRFFEKGTDVPRDVVKAHARYTLAAAQGMPEASKARDVLAREMSREELAEAYRLAIEWSSADGSGNSVADASPDFVSGEINEDADMALSEGDATVVSNHLAAGLDPNAIDRTGETLLNRAVESGNIAVIEAMLDAGARVNAPGKGGRKPVSIAVAAGREDVVALLVDRGADPAVTDAPLADAPLADSPLADSGEKLAAETPPEGGEPIGPETSAVDGGISREVSRTQPALDGFETGAGQEDRADNGAFDTPSREKISRDLLGATAGDGQAVALATPEETSEPAPRQPTASPMVAPTPAPTVAPTPASTASPTRLTGNHAIAPPVSGKIQQARIRPDKPATTLKPSSRPARKDFTGVASLPPVSETRVRTVQYLLARLGYDPGPADGVAGQKTLAAVRAYRKDKGEWADGGITAALVRRLDADVVAEKSRRLAESDVTPVRKATPRQRREDTDVWVGFLGGVQKLLGLEFDSTKNPGKMRKYCAKNTENWIYDFGTERFILCRDLVHEGPTASR